MEGGIRLILFRTLFVKSVSEQEPVIEGPSSLLTLSLVKAALVT